MFNYDYIPFNKGKISAAFHALQSNLEWNISRTVLNTSVPLGTVLVRNIDWLMVDKSVALRPKLLSSTNLRDS